MILYNIHVPNLTNSFEEYNDLISVKVSVTFTMRLMSNHIPKMTQVPIEINGILPFPQIWHGESF